MSTTATLHHGKEHVGAPVGANGKNDPADVRRVQSLLFEAGAAIPIDGVCTPGLIDAIKRYQLNWDSTPDGRIDPGARHGSGWERAR